MRAFIYSMTGNKTRCEISDEPLPDVGEQILYPDAASSACGRSPRVHTGRVVSRGFDYVRGEIWIQVEEQVSDGPPAEKESPHCDCEQPGNTYGNDKGVICCMRCGRVAG